MKTVYRFLTVGAMSLALTAVTATASFAQDDEKTTLYTQFTACYKETDTAKRDACYAIAKQYLDKYEKSADGTVDQYGAFVRKRYDTYVAGKKNDETFGRFDKAIKDPKAVNADEAFASGKDVLAIKPDLVDVPIVLASIGFDNAVAATPNDKYNADAVNYAKLALQKMDAGAPSTQYGAYGYTFKNKDNATGWMNYYIGFIMYNRMNQKKEALPYFYKATQVNSDTKNTAEVYRLIGSWYADEFVRLDTARVEKIKAANNQDTDETKADYAMEKGYAERAADAYARAAKIASTTPTASKEYKDALLARAKQFYGIRFNNDPAKTDGYDAYATAAVTKAFVDPTTAVTPVVEETPATTTTTTTGTATATTPATTTTKPTTATATTVPTPKPATTTTTTTNKTTTTTTKKP